MTPVDIAILEWLDDKGMAAPPSQIHAYFPGGEEQRPTQTHVNRRLRVLEDHDMVERHHEYSSLYGLSEKGGRYLNDPDAKAEEFMPEDEEDEDDDREESEE